MPVPANIRSVARPINTVVVDTGRNGSKRYAVRERSYIKYVPGGNPQPRNGRIIGHIIDERFVSNTEDQKANKISRLDNIPDELKAKGAFCLWKYEQIGDRKAKVPYNPSSVSCKAATNRPETFCNYSKAVEVLKANSEQFEGIGIRVDGDIIGIDIDNVSFDEKGELIGSAKDIVNELNSYTEVSPSGKGLRIFCKAEGLNFDKSKYYIMHDKIEVYIPGYTNRYLTVTGNILKRKKVLPDRTKELQNILDDYMLRGKQVQINGL